MKPPTLEIHHLGQIQQASLVFGDLTVFVGPQATGKSIALQLLKLMVDAGQVQEELNRYGIDWSGKLSDFMDAYFGEGMRSIWKGGKTKIRWQGAEVDLERLARRKRAPKEESLFFIPAQRVLALRDGWPRPFTDYSPGDRESGTTRDISALDPAIEEEGGAGWGGLSEFSGRASEAVAHAVANSQR